MIDRKMPMPDDEPTMTPRRVAQCLGVTDVTVREAIKRGDLPSIRVGHRYLVPTAPLRQVLGLDPPTSTPGERVGALAQDC